MATTYDPRKLLLTFEDPRDGDFVYITMEELLKNGVRINVDKIEMEFVCADIN